MKRWDLIVVVGWLVLLLAGCGQGDTAVTPTTVSPAPTQMPTTVPSPSAPPQPLITSSPLPWWNDAVFYEVFVRSFYDSDGDGIGDLNGLIEKLDYLNDGDPATITDLGVTGLWLMPIMVSPSYHGYDVVDYYQVNPAYGTNEDFQRLMAEAHARGIRVIVDLVLNHTGRDHPWFQASRDPASAQRNWYVWVAEDPGYRGPDGQKVWHYTPDGYYYALFWDGMPDVNYANPEVTTAMYDAARFWLEEMGADGFRLDAIKHLVEEGAAQENTLSTHAWLQAFYTFYKDVNPDALAVGEAWTSTQQVLDYTGDEVDIAFQFDLAEDIINSSQVGIGSIAAKTLADIVTAYPPGQYATFITNHDQNRVMSQLGEDEGKARVAASLLLTSPGVPFVYYGEEIGMIGTKPDEDIRRPMQWTSDNFRTGFTTGLPWRAPADDYEERSVALQDDDPHSLLNHYRQLIHLRNGHEALRVGAWTPLETHPGRVYAFLRHTAVETLLVIINLSDKQTTNYTLSLESGPLVTGMEAAVLLGEGTAVPPIISANGGVADYTPLVALPPHSTFIISLTPDS